MDDTEIIQNTEAKVHIDTLSSFKGFGGRIYKINFGLRTMDATMYIYLDGARVLVVGPNACNTDDRGHAAQHGKNAGMEPDIAKHGDSSGQGRTIPAAGGGNTRDTDEIRLQNKQLLDGR